jgi:hypothetical protein
MISLICLRIFAAGLGIFLSDYSPESESGGRGGYPAYPGFLLTKGHIFMYKSDDN